MMTITRPQADALAALIHTMRPREAEWGIPGIVKALSDARDRGTAWDLAHAALYCAEDLTARTPAVIALPGPHWTRGRDLGSTTGTVARCEREGHQGKPAHNCPYCRSEQLGRDDEAPAPATDPDRADAYARGARRARAAIDHARTRHQEDQ